jgi:hypothetical protein
MAPISELHTEFEVPSVNAGGFFRTWQVGACCALAVQQMPAVLVNRRTAGAQHTASAQHPSCSCLYTLVKE